MSALRRRLGDPHVLFDVLVALVVAVLAVADVAGSSSGRSSDRAADAFAYVLAIGAAASLFWRRRAPIVVLTIVTAALVVLYLRDYGAYLSVIGLPALYAVAAHEEHRRRAWWAMTLAGVALLAAASVSLLDTDEGFAIFSGVSMAAFVAGTIAAGVVMRNRERIFVDTERRAAEAERERAAEAERAVANERSRIAREMHDVVAHSMSVISVQAAAGREIVHTNPDKAAEVFGRIEAVGRESLAELRRMLGVLRDTGGGGPSLTPQPGVADISTAVAESSASGVATELVVEGEQRGLAPGIELAAFRIVQESLTNVRKHAGAAASAVVRLEYRPDVLVVEVTDDGRGAATSLSATGAGHGLIGMRERVDVYGGELTAGPRAGGGFAVRAMLPVLDAPPVADVAGPGAPASTSTTRDAP